MKTNNKLIWKGLFLNKERTFTTLLMIIVIVATFTGIAIMYESGIAGMKSSIISTRGDFDIKVKELNPKYDKKEIEDLNTFKDIYVYDVLSKEESKKEKAELLKLKDKKEKTKEEEILSAGSEFADVVKKQNRYEISKYKLKDEKADKKLIEKIDKAYIASKDDKKEDFRLDTMKSGLKLFGINKFENFGKNGIYLVSGEYPKDETEIIISEGSDATNTRYFNIGDEIFLNDKNFKKLKVVGIFKGSLDEGNSDIIAITNSKEISKDYTKMFLAKFKNVKKEAILTQTKNSLSKIGYNVKDYDTEKNEAKTKQEKQKEISDNYDVENGNVVFNDLLLELKEANRGKYGSEHKDLGFFVIIRNALILVVGILASIIIYNGFNMSVVEKKKQYGILKSLGMTTKQIYGVVLKEALILAAVGIIFGLIFGILGDYITINVINGKVSEISRLVGYTNSSIFKIIFSINMGVINVVLVSTFILIIVSSLIPAIKASRTSAIDVIKGIDDYKLKNRKVRTSKLVKKLLGYKFDLARKNMKRVKSKFRIATISLTISFILIFTIETINFMVNTQLNMIDKKTKSFITPLETMITGLIENDEKDIDTNKIFRSQKEKIQKDLNANITGAVLIENGKNDLIEGDDSKIYNSSYLKYIKKQKEAVHVQYNRNIENYKKTLELNKHILSEENKENENKENENKKEKEKLSPIQKSSIALRKKLNNQALEALLVDKKYQEQEKNRKVTLGYVNADLLADKFKNKYKLNDLKDGDIKIADRVLVLENKNPKEYNVFKRNNKDFKILRFSTSDKKQEGATLKQEYLNKNNIEYLDDFEANIINNSAQTTEVLPNVTIFVNNKTFNEILNQKTKITMPIIISELEAEENKSKVLRIKELNENIENSKQEFKTKDGNLTIITAINLNQTADILKTIMYVLKILLFGFLMLMIIMAIINIFANISINILLRSKELAILQSIGMTKKGIGQMLRYENYILSIKAVIYGSVISLGIIYSMLQFGLYKNEKVKFKTVLEFITPRSVISAVCIIIVITLISTLYAKRKVSRQDIIEVVRKENI